MTILRLTRDINGLSTFGLPWTNDNYEGILTAESEQTVTAPTSNSSGYLAVFSFEPGTKVWVGIGSTGIAAPSGALAPSKAQLNPATREVAAGETVRFITNNTTAEMGVSFYALAPK